MGYLEKAFEAAIAIIAVGLMSLFFCYAWPDKEYGLSGWVQAIGSIAAIVAAGYGLRKQLRHTEQLAVDSRVDSRRDVVVALSAELGVYRVGLERLDQTIANSFPSMLNGMLQTVFPIASLRFPIYSANAAAISAVSDELLRRKLIGLYADLDMLYALLDRNSAVAGHIPHDQTPSGEIAYELKGLHPLIKDQLAQLRPLLDDVIEGLERQLQVAAG